MLFIIFFAYGGFARIAVVSEEVKDAKRNVPLALLLSLGISMVVYILVGISGSWACFSTQLASSTSPLTTAISVTGNMTGGTNCFNRRLSGYGKRFVDFDFGGFKDGVFDGTRKRFALRS